MRSRHAVYVAAGLAGWLGIVAGAHADEPARPREPAGLRARAVDEDCAQATAPEERSSQDVAPEVPLAHGRAVSGLTPDECRASLDRLGIRYEDAHGEGAAVDAIEQPIRLGGPLGSLEVRPHGGDPRSIHSILDCRLALALYEWGPTLRAAGFVGIEHVSVFRPGARVAGSHRASGHSHALAIDALLFVRADGTTLSVLDDWAVRTRGADPCAQYDEPVESRALREAVCAGARDELFEVIVTPHHDDAHANHVHLEVVPGVDWTALR